jgi:hypothetical protein
LVRTAKIATVAMARADPLGKVAAETLDAVRALVRQRLGL